MLEGTEEMCECVCVAVRELLKTGASPDLFNEDGLTALHQVHTHTCIIITFLHCCIFRLEPTTGTFLETQEV